MKKYPNPILLRRSLIPIIFFPALAIVASADQKSIAVSTETKVPEIYHGIFLPTESEYASEAARASLPFSLIEIERLGPYEPYLKISYYRSGAVKIIYGDPKSDHDLKTISTTIRGTEFARICYLLEELNFSGLKDDYEATWNHATSIIVRANSDIGSKKVTEFGRVGPIRLWVIQQILLRLEPADPRNEQNR